MPAAVLVHGLAGCADANYVVRVSRLLLELGIRVVRVNLRGSGDGFGLARQIYHAGRSDDLRQVVRWLHARAPGSPIALDRLLAGCQSRAEGGNRSGRSTARGRRLPCWPPMLPSIWSTAPTRCGCPRIESTTGISCAGCERWSIGCIADFPSLADPGLEGVRTLVRLRRSLYGPAGPDSPRPTTITLAAASADTLGRIKLPGLVVHAMDDPFIGAEPFLNIENPPASAVELVHARRSSRLSEPEALDGLAPLAGFAASRPGSHGTGAGRLEMT